MSNGTFNIECYGKYNEIYKNLCYENFVVTRLLCSYIIAEFKYEIFNIQISSNCYFYYITKRISITISIFYNFDNICMSWSYLYNMLYLLRNTFNCIIKMYVNKTMKNLHLILCNIVTSRLIKSWFYKVILFIIKDL